MERTECKIRHSYPKKRAAENKEDLLITEVKYLTLANKYN